MKGKRFALALVVIVLVVAGGALSGCVRVDRFADEGNRTTRHYDLAGFKKIEIGNAFELQVIPSDNYSVTVTAGNNFLGKLDVTLRGDTLVFRTIGWSFSFNQSPKAVVTMPELTGLDLSGAVSGTARGFTTDGPFDMKLSGASNLDMGLVTGPFHGEVSGASRAGGDLTAASTQLDLSGASSFDVAGSGGDITLDVSGASRAELRDYPVANADADVSGASTAYLDLTGRLDASVSGASRLSCTGTPVIGSLSVTGGSSFEQG